MILLALYHMYSYHFMLFYFGGYFYTFYLVDGMWWEWISWIHVYGYINFETELWISEIWLYTLWDWRMDCWDMVISTLRLKKQLEPLLRESMACCWMERKCMFSCHVLSKLGLGKKKSLVSTSIFEKNCM